jgi:hypothetical protein
MMPALAPVVRPLCGAAGAGEGVGVVVELPGEQPLWQPDGPSVQLGDCELEVAGRAGWMLTRLRCFRRICVWER